MNSFTNYTFYEVLWIFLIYSFVGWCTEVVYAATVEGKFVNRGFGIGPVCPIYGFGVLSVLVFLEPIKEQWGLLFFASVVFTSLIEFLGGYILEKLFHEKWWDYSDEPFNLKGYICLKFSLLWGFACVLVINVVHPTVMKLIRFIPQRLGIVLLSLLFAVFFTDFTVTLINILKIRRKLRAIDEIETALQKLSESIGTNLSDRTIAVMEQGEKLKETISEKEPNISEIKSDVIDSINDRRTELKDSIAEKRAEAEALREKLKMHIADIEKSGKRISRAFPNIGKGRYKHIFKK